MTTFFCTVCKVDEDITIKCKDRKVCKTKYNEARKKKETEKVVDRNKIQGTDCKNCKQVFDHELFNWKGTRWTGWCRECENARKRELQSSQRSKAKRKLNDPNFIEKERERSARCWVENRNVYNANRRKKNH